MDRDTDLFVQAFWVKCRDVIRPELDRVIDELKSAGHDASVSTQEYSPVADQLPDIGPVLTLTVHPKGAPEGRTLQFHGDVAKANLEIIGNGGKPAHRFELASLDETVTKREIANWLAVALNHNP
jgi:hypothetical protein